MNGEEGGEQSSERFAAGDEQLSAGGEGRGGSRAGSGRFATGDEQQADGGEGWESGGGRSLG